MKPSDLPLEFLQNITNKFSNERILGTGGYGRVFKGVDRNGNEIAVKLLHPMVGLDDVQFKNEFNSLMMVRHRNIVRLVGYCHKLRFAPFEQNGKILWGNIQDRVLCLEYLEQGSLDKHLNEESSGHDWPTRFKIIKGICEGLDYLHRGYSTEGPILHLDLKPANILLDRNMVPKIADFGLSRLFGGTHTHTTKNCVGTEAYMPPEYILKRQITEKYDVFSLGIIIIEIMAGQGAYARTDMPSHEFIDHVHRNWRERIESTPGYESPEKDCQQVKRCIELALKCVEMDRHKRPTTRDITRQLRQIETNGSASRSEREQARPAKIGQWGGIGGSLADIDVAPCRLKSLIVCSGKVIYSLEFSYDDHDGRQHTAGPWGGYGPEGHGNVRDVIDLGPSEFITEVSGTIGPFERAPGGVVKSLTIITNMNTYGPFGDAQGTPFNIPTRDNSSIVGFFGRTGWYVDSFGVYANPDEQKTEPSSGLVKIGPWGGNGGQEHDIKEAPPHRLESVTICSGTIIHSLHFTYRDNHGGQHTAGPWGSSGTETVSDQSRFSNFVKIIKLGDKEFLTGILGKTGPFAHAISADDVVTSLTLVTNERSYGPFGDGGGTPFQIQMWEKGSIVGFFGRAESCLNAIGIYVHPHQQEMQEELICSHEAGYTRVGPWGGIRGTAHDMETEKQPHRIESVTITCGAVINSIAFSYTDFDGDTHTAGPWGTPAGNAYKIQFKPLERLQGVYGTIGSFGALPNVITSLAFAGTLGAYGPFGEGGGVSFASRAEKDGCIVGFFGHAGSCLEALGFYVHRY